MIVNAVKFAEKADDQEVIWTHEFVLNRRATHKRFVVALARIMEAAKSVDWDVKQHPAILNTSYTVKVTGPGHRVALIIKYFMACGF